MPIDATLGNFALTQQIARLLEDAKIDGKLTPVEKQRLVALLDEMTRRGTKAVE